MFTNDLAHTLEDLLVIKEGESVSALQRIRANPSKPSVEPMLALLRKFTAIGAAGDEGC